MKLSMTIYSFNKHFAENRMDVKGFIQKARELGVEAVELGYFWKNEAQELREVNGWLRENGIELSGYIVGNDFAFPEGGDRKAEIEKVKHAIDCANELGTDKLRIFAAYEAKGKTFDEVASWILEPLKEVVDYAAQKKIILALENHGRVCDTNCFVDILTQINSPYLRANIDFGNFLIFDEDPVASTKRLLKWMSMGHIKDYKEEPEGDMISQTGRRYSGCIIGEGGVDLTTCLRIVEESGYNGYVSLEYEGKEDPEVAVPKSLRYIKDIMSRT